MRFPWQTAKTDTRIARLDPHVPVGLPYRGSDAEVIEKYNRAVAENVARRDDRKVISIFHRRQAE